MRLAPKQAAARMDVSVSLVYGLLKEGKLKAIRVGVRGRGKWLIEESAVEEFLKGCQVEALQPPLKHIR